MRKGVLRNFACNFIKKETLAQVFSCEFCEISKAVYAEIFLSLVVKFFFRQFPFNI